MKSPLPWLGGKSRLADRIVQLIPAHDHYAEVFAGAGWVFFRKPESKYESINDINSDLISFYRCCQNHLEEVCRQFKWLLSSREFFEDFRSQMDGRGLTDIQRAARFYFLQRQAFGGKVDGGFGVDYHGLPKINLVRLEEELSRVHLRLTRVRIENLSWTDHIRRYDDKKTFFYLDPPYHGGERDYGKGIFSRKEYAAMAEQLAGIEGKFLLSINDVPEIRETFSAFDIREVETTYSVCKDNNQRVGELLIMNYDPAPGLLGMCANG
nr:DNA adenine methylase [Pseudodesulfovibrio sp.]